MTDPTAVVFAALEGLQGTAHHLPPGTRQAVAEHLARVLPAVPSAAAPPTQAALLGRIAGAVRSVLPMSSSLTHDVVADAVLAVLPAPVDRAAVRAAALREAADFYERVLEQSLDPGSDPRYCTAVRDIVMGLRRRAAEEQPAETQAPCGRLASIPSPCSAGDHCCEGRFTAEELAAAQADVDELNALFPDDEPADLPAVGEQPDTQTREAQRCPAKHGALGRICKLPLGHTGMHTGSGPNGGAVWDGDAP